MPEWLPGMYMSFLIEGEKVIKRFSQSRMVHIKLYLAAVALFLFPVVYTLYFSTMIRLPISEAYLASAAVASGLALIFIAEIQRRFGCYYITNYRVISIKGTLKKTMDSCTYDKIVNVKIVQSLLQRIIGTGTIDITTYQKTEILLSSIGNPTGIEKMIYSAMEKPKERAAAPVEPARQPEVQPAARSEPQKSVQAAVQQESPAAEPLQKSMGRQAVEELKARAAQPKKKRFGIF
jgi:uncharacterized membrane protein YdbT with pleckstrin-like domain